MVVTHALSLNINRRVTFGIRSGGGRNPIGRRSEHDDKTQQLEQKKVAEVSGLRSTKSNTNCISALLVAAEAGDLRYFCWSHFYVLRRPETSATFVGHTSTCCGGRRPPLLLLVTLLRAAEARDLRYFCWSHFYVLRRPETSATNILLKNIFKREVREYRCRLTQHTDELLC